MIQLSVVIPSYRSKQSIVECLKALMDQSLARQFYEVIVVDSSDDGTEVLIQERFPSVRLTHLKEKTLPGEARNHGVKQAVGEYIAFMDADCVADSGLLQGMLDTLSHTEFAGVGGAVKNGTPGSLAGWVEYILSFKEFTPKAPQRVTRHIPTCNLTLRKNIFERYGLFPTDFFPGEDAVFNWKLSRGGERFLFDPKLQVTHLNRTGFQQVLMHQYRYGRAFAITRNRFPMPGRIFVTFPLLSLGIPMVRWISVLSKLRWDFKLLGISLILSPLIFLGLTFWAVGFWRQLQEEEAREAQTSK